MASRAITRILGTAAVLLAAVLPARADWFRESAAAGFVPPASLTVALDDDYAPYSFAAEHGDAQGIVRDLWELWSKKTGVAVRYRVTPRVERMAMLDHGQADVVGFVMSTEQRESRYLLALAPVAKIDAAIFFGRDIQGIAGPDSLAGFTVGVTENGSCAEWLAAHGITRLRSYPSWTACSAPRPRARSTSSAAAGRPASAGSTR